MKRLILATATLLFAVGCNCTQPKNTAQNQPKQNYTAKNYSQNYTSQNQPTQNYTAQNYPLESQADFVGPRGPDGPVGAKGAQGATGQTGVAGYAAAGPRGSTGPIGAIGEQGRVGARGPSGDVVVGPAGITGPAGNTGEQGQIGQTGVQGVSSDGYAGPTGPIGQTGVQGSTGDMGVKGATLVGPAGPAGRIGPSGEQGEPGQIGAQGSATAGVVGATGVAGDAGPQGLKGPTGPQGPTGVIERWISYRDFMFDTDKAIIHDTDKDKVAEIAAYMKGNPSLQLGIDGATNLQATEGSDQDLLNRRVKAVRDALVQAGVSSERISNGIFGDVNLRRNGRVEVLIKTDRLTQASFSPAGSTGDVERWANYQNFSFDANKADIQAGDVSKVNGIAAYLKQNQSLRAGIDSSMNPNSTDPSKLDLAKRRGDAVRDALITAGVPATRIERGVFGDNRLRRDGQVEVLIKTDRLTQASFSPAGSTGVVERWISYRDFMFDTDKAVIHDADKDTVAEIAAYMKGNPSLQLGIDGTTNPQATEGRDLDLLNRRVKAVRDALVQAGVSSERISDGIFGDVNLRRNGRVEVLIKTDRLTQAPFSPIGPIGDVGRWANYQNFWFDDNTADIHPGDMSKVYGIASHLKENQSLRAGIDSSMNPDSSDPSKLDLAKRRGDAIRDALIAAGVPATSIERGVFGDSQIRRDGQVEVLIRRLQMTQSQ